MIKNAYNRLLAGIGALLLILWSYQAAAAFPFFGKEEKPTLAPMLKEVIPAVVNVSTRSKVRIEENPLFNDPFFRRFFGIPDMPLEQETQSLGSGVIVDAEKGYIITNNHVIDKAEEITVILRDRRQFDAKVIGADPEADVAVIQIKADNLVALPLADSDQLQVGDFVTAIGNPFGLGQTVTSGIVSALERSGLGIEGYENFIQTDASINPGNSGGALVNWEGKLVGINTAIVGPSGGNVGIGFAIPSNMVRNIKEQLIKYGEVRRGQLGVYIQDLTPDLAEALHLERVGGAVIAQVMQDSPADKAGLKAGDVVTAVDGEAIQTAAELRNEIGLLPIGTEITLDIIRDGKQKKMRVAIKEPKQYKAVAGEVSEQLSGAVLGEIEPTHPLAGRIQGVEVVNVERGSPAWEAGLRRGDIIVSINRRPAQSLQEARAILRQSKGSLLLNIRRGEAALFLVIR